MNKQFRLGSTWLFDVRYNFAVPSTKGHAMQADASKRRWLQISLKSLLILTVIVAAYFAGLATMLRRAERAEKQLKDHLDASRRSDIKLQVAAAEAEVAVLRDQLAATERLFKKGYVSSLQLQAAKLQLQTGQAKLAKAAQLLDARPQRTPSD